MYYSRTVLGVGRLDIKKLNLVVYRSHTNHQKHRVVMHQFLVSFSIIPIINFFDLALGGKVV